MIKIKPGSEERDVWPIRKRILDMHRVGKTGWPEKLKVQVEVNPRKEPYVTEMGKLLRWLKKMSVTEYIKVEWSPPCSIAKVGSRGDIVATFRTSTVWKIDEKVLQAFDTRTVSLRGNAEKMILKTWIAKPRGMLLVEEDILHRGGWVCWAPLRAWPRGDHPKVKENWLNC